MLSTSTESFAVPNGRELCTRVGSLTFKVSMRSSLVTNVTSNFFSWLSSSRSLRAKNVGTTDCVGGNVGLDVVGELEGTGVVGELEGAHVWDAVVGSLDGAEVLGALLGEVEGAAVQALHSLQFLKLHLNDLVNVV